jgi:hypothetical protein
MYHSVGNIDLDTGELLQGVPVWVGVKSSPYGNRWFMAHQEALLSIAGDKELTVEPYRVLMVLLAKLDFENWILKIGFMCSRKKFVQHWICENKTFLVPFNC